MIKLYLENKLNRYFPSVRGGVWLIVLPAIFIIIFYFFSSFTEIVIKSIRARVTRFRLVRPIRKILLRFSIITL